MLDECREYAYWELFIKVVLLFNFYIVWCVELRLDAREYFAATYRLLSTFIAAAVGRFPADIRGTTNSIETSIVFQVLYLERFFDSDDDAIRRALIRLLYRTVASSSRRHRSTFFLQNRQRLDGRGLESRRARVPASGVFA